MTIVRATARLAAIALLLGASVLFVAVGLGPRAGRYRTLTVLSGSMRPAFAPGDLLVVVPEPRRDIRAGDVITYAIPIGDRHVETHRVVSVRWRNDEPIVRTQGDANARPDPWTAQLHSATVWHEAFAVPKLGRPILWLRKPLVHRAFVFVAPALLVLLGLSSIWRPSRTPRRRPSRVPSV
jgi:signal peptidase